MKKKAALTKDSFDELLNWLHPDRETAALKYEEIRQALIRIFVRRACSPAEDMADETINRVIGKLAEIRSGYVGDPRLYFYGVAQNIIREFLRAPQPQYHLFKQPEPEEDDPDYQCLEECIAKLPSESRWLIIEYFQEENREKINHRKRVADQLGISPHNLRMRAYRIKSALKSCILECRNRQKTG